MHLKNQVLHIRSEKEILAESKTDWVVDLKFSFQVLYTFLNNIIRMINIYT